MVCLLLVVRVGEVCQPRVCPEKPATHLQKMNGSGGDSLDLVGKSCPSSPRRSDEAEDRVVVSPRTMAATVDEAERRNEEAGWSVVPPPDSAAHEVTNKSSASSLTATYIAERMVEKGMLTDQTANLAPGGGSFSVPGIGPSLSDDAFNLAGTQFPGLSASSSSTNQTPGTVLQGMSGLFGQQIAGMGESFLSGMQPGTIPSRIPQMQQSSGPPFTASHSVGNFPHLSTDPPSVHSLPPHVVAQMMTSGAFLSGAGGRSFPQNQQQGFPVASSNVPPPSGLAGAAPNPNGPFPFGLTSGHYVAPGFDLTWWTDDGGGDGKKPPPSQSRPNRSWFVPQGPRPVLAALEIIGRPEVAVVSSSELASAITHFVPLHLESITTQLTAFAKDSTNLETFMQAAMPAIVSFAEIVKSLVDELDEVDLSGEPPEQMSNFLKVVECFSKQSAGTRAKIAITTTEALKMCSLLRPLHISANFCNSRAKTAEQLVGHPGILCDGCDKSISGIRYRCTTRENFDLCASCYLTEGVDSHEQYEGMLSSTFVPTPSPKAKARAAAKPKPKATPTHPFGKAFRSATQTGGGTLYSYPDTMHVAPTSVPPAFGSNPALYPMGPSQPQFGGMHVPTDAALGPLAGRVPFAIPDRPFGPGGSGAYFGMPPYHPYPWAPWGPPMMMMHGGWALPGGGCCPAFRSYCFCCQPAQSERSSCRGGQRVSCCEREYRRSRCRSPPSEEKWRRHCDNDNDDHDEVRLLREDEHDKSRGSKKTLANNCTTVEQQTTTNRLTTDAQPQTPTRTFRRVMQTSPNLTVVRETSPGGAEVEKKHVYRRTEQTTATPAKGGTPQMVKSYNLTEETRGTSRQPDADTIEMSGTRTVTERVGSQPAVTQVVPLFEVQPLQSAIRRVGGEGSEDLSSDDVLSAKLAAMENLGFDDRAKNIEALALHGKDVKKALRYMMKMEC